MQRVFSYDAISAFAQEMAESEEEFCRVDQICSSEDIITTERKLIFMASLFDIYSEIELNSVVDTVNFPLFRVDSISQSVLIRRKNKAKKEGCPVCGGSHFIPKGVISMGVCNDMALECVDCNTRIFHSLGTNRGLYQVLDEISNADDFVDKLSDWFVDNSDDYSVEDHPSIENLIRDFILYKDYVAKCDL